MLLRKRQLKLETERLTLRLPRHADFRAWTALRAASADFLTPWEPSWAHDHLSRKSFTGRVYWAQRAMSEASAVPLFILRRSDDALLGRLRSTIFAVVRRRPRRLAIGLVRPMPAKAICARRSR